MVEHSAVNRRAIGSSPICPAIMRKYPRGWRGSPAKGVGHQKWCEGSNPSFRAKEKNIINLLTFANEYVIVISSSEPNKNTPR